MWNEVEAVRKLIDTKKADYGLDGLLKRILDREPMYIYEYPCLYIAKLDSSELGYLGETGPYGQLENAQPTSIVINIETQKNIAKQYDSVWYKDEGLARLISERLHDLMFHNKQWQDTEQPELRWIVSEMTSNREGAGIVRVGPIFACTQLYSIRFEILR